MKKLFLVLSLLFVTIISFGQDSIYHPVRVDLLKKIVGYMSVGYPNDVVDDSTGVLQFRDVRELQKKLRDLPAQYGSVAEELISWLEARYEKRAMEMLFKRVR